ncbi:hypothetical protein [Amycolatopsis suaedae]|uniref:Uncharacterized protein n=1 Tax=Amycolatopsis suaedae TaxID=2510978 RepID=A0A4Q7JBQ7_9PSEU|nr:hypothetical protein [Amycolatopsis suaedae]RZQ64528.1 hypothetical protein EWH70_06300 [Amycolatopsis suaedae]
MTWRQWLALAAGLLAVVSLFLPWTVLSAADPEVEAVLREMPESDVVRSVWLAGFFGWSPPFLLLATGVAVVLYGHRRAARVSGLPQVWLVLAILSLAMAVLGWLLIDTQFGAEQRGLLADAGVGIDAAAGRYLCLAAAVVSLVGAVLDSRRRPGNG